MSKNEEPILSPEEHLAFYEIAGDNEPFDEMIMVEDQFGEKQLFVHFPVKLGVPSRKISCCR